MNTPSNSHFGLKNIPSAAVASPCVSVCRINAANGLCTGCWRTLDEIAAWGQASDETKRAVWSRIHERRSAQDS